MTLLLVSKWVATVAITCVDIDDDTHIYGCVIPVRNVRTVDTCGERSIAEILFLNPLRLCIRGTRLYDTMPTRLVKLITSLHAVPYLHNLTTLTSLNITSGKTDEPIDLTALIHLRKLTTSLPVHIDGLALVALHLEEVELATVTCTTLRKLIVENATPPELAPQIQLDEFRFSAVEIPESYLEHTRTLSRLCADDSKVPDGFYNLQLCKFDAWRIPTTNISAIAWTSLQRLKCFDTTPAITSPCIMLTALSTNNVTWFRIHKAMFPALVSLKLNSNDIIDSDVSDLTTLTRLQLRPGATCNSYTGAAFRNLVSLRSLQFSHNYVVEARGLSHLDNLTTLDIVCTRINESWLWSAFDRHRSLYGVTTANPLQHAARRGFAYFFYNNKYNIESSPIIKKYHRKYRISN